MNAANESEAKALMSAGIRLVKQGKRDEAVRKFLQLINQYPDSSLADNAYYNLGQIYMKKEEWAKARTAFNAVLTQYPNSDAAMFAGDMLDEIIHQEDPAIELFEQAQAAYIKGEFKRSRALYEKLLEENPESELADNAYFALGMIGKRFDDQQMAEKNFRIVRERYPDSDAARLLEEMK